MTTGWVYLYAGVIAAGFSMPLAKLANGFENLQYSIPAMVLYGIATACWLMAMKQLPLSTAWLVWLGMDVVIMLGVSYFMFHESFSLGKVVCMLLILSGCIGLNLLEMKK
jgi:quaternary ammonium compound-resistance protein SugE